MNPRRILLTLSVAGAVTLGGAGSASAHEMSCNAHLPPIHVHMILAGYHCIKLPGWHNRIRYYRTWDASYRDVVLTHHPCTFCTVQEAWKIYPIVRR